MVDTQVRPSDVTRFPIIDALLETPREVYVPDAKRAIAYMGDHIELEPGRVVLDPRLFAKMLELVNVQPDESILDLGCGLGYSTAVLARLGTAVVGIEPDESRAVEAQRLVSAQGVDNAAIIAGDLAAGAASAGPFDVILLQGAIARWPDALTDQLREGGRAVALWQEQGLGTVRLGVRRAGQMSWRDGFNGSAPILSGFEADPQFML